MNNNFRFFSSSVIRNAKRHLVPPMLLLNMLVFLEPDSLVFTADNEIVDTWYIGERTERTSAGTLRITTHAVVSQDSSSFLYFREAYRPETDSIDSELALYRADGQNLWLRTAPQGRTFARFFTEFIDDMIVIVTSNQYGAAPSMELMTPTGTDTILGEGDWYRLSSYAFSPNRRFMIMHVKNPYHEKVWDYIHFIDRDTDSTWSYLFPLCVTCKRYKHIDVSVDDEGISEVVYKGEHRLFDRQGVLIDVFIKF